MSERQVVYFDIETTGLEADKNEMTAIQYLVQEMPISPSYILMRRR